MSRLALKFILPATLIFLALSLVARSLGSLQPPNPVLLGFNEDCEDKPQPCWYGIVPGVTTASEATHVLEGQGYRNFHQSDRSYTLSFKRDNPKLPRVDFEAACDDVQHNICDANPLLWIVIFIGLSDVTVGDVIVTLGQPVSIGFNPVLGPALFYSQLNIGLQDWISPHHNTEGFEFYASLRDMSSAATWSAFSRWHGFAPSWRYCQLEHNPADCPQ